MSWQPLSAFVRRAWPAVERTAGAEPPDVRTAAAAVAMLTWGPAAALESPALVNVGGLAWQARRRLVVHQVRAGAARLVHKTDLHSLPPDPPALLRGAWLIESPRAERGETLFGDCAALGGYTAEDGSVFLIGAGYPDGVVVARWRPQWIGGELEEGIRQDRSPLVDDVDQHQDWARQAARFALVFAMLMEATGVPVRSRDERISGMPSSWIVRRVGLTGSAGEIPAIDMRELVEVRVRGHLRRVGDRVVWVEGHTERRWIAPDAAKIVRH